MNLPEMVTTGVMTMSHGTAILVLDPGGSAMPALEEVAHSLSRLTRFNGHLFNDVDVATHSLALHSIVPRPLKLRALLHDASEVILGDMVRPLKNTNLMAPYRLLEYQWQARLYRKLGHEDMIPYEAECMDPPELCALDAAITRYEARVYGRRPFWERVANLTANWRDLDEDEEERAAEAYNLFLHKTPAQRAEGWMGLVTYYHNHPEYCM